MSNPLPSHLLPPPQIIHKGGKDLDGSWGTGKTFGREEYFELINLSTPYFMLSPFIPVYNSLHPQLPFAIAQDSRIADVKPTKIGYTLTVSTTYKILKHNMPLNGLSGWDLTALIAGNLPHLLPAQDVSYEVVPIEETLNEIYVEKTWDEKVKEAASLPSQISPNDIYPWKTEPFRTSAGTRLLGSKTRNIIKMSFWYFVQVTPLFDEAEILVNYTGVVNDRDIIIGGRYCPMGTAKIEAIEFPDGTWERPGVQYPFKMIAVVLLLDNQTWNKSYENVSNLFMAYPYEWDNSSTGNSIIKKENVKLKFDSETHQPKYELKKNVSPQRIFCTTYDPEPQNVNEEECEVADEAIWIQDPQNSIQFFGTREDCFRLNPDSKPTETSEPMYLDKNGFILYPDIDTGKVDVALSPKVEGYIFKPVNFAPLHFPTT